MKVLKNSIFAFMADFRRNNRFKGNGGAFKGSRLNRSNDRRENGGRRELGRQQSGECFTLRIEKMVQGGEGMARLEDGRVCFVAGALPGELCKVRLTFQKKDFTKGCVVEVIEPSPDRVKPLCPLYGKCGGCSLQHLASEKQAEYLEKVERENFRRLAHAELPEDFVIHTGNAWGYRNRARVVFRGNVGGNVGGDMVSANREGSANRARFGFRGEESNNIVPFENCPVLTDALNEFLRGPAAALISEGLAGGSNGKLSSRDDSRRLPRELDVNIFDNGKGEISFYYPGMHKSDFDAHAISVVEIGGCKIEADASVFFQSNLGLLPELVEAVRKAVDEGLASGKATNDWLIDLFSGVGFFACILQDKFKKITTVEREEGCLRHAKVNLSEPCEEIPASAGMTKCGLAGMTKCSSAEMTNSVENVSAPAEDWLLENVVDVPATLIVDPPRTGLPKEALEAIIKSSVNRLIYVSCDPVTLARDYAKFTEAGFTLSHAEGFAFYPQTPHLEMMFVLSR